MASFRPALTGAPQRNHRIGAALSIPGRALAPSMLDSLCQRSRTGVTPPISTSVPSTPWRLAASARPDQGHSLDRHISLWMLKA